MKFGSAERLNALTHHDPIVRDAILDICLAFNQTNLSVTQQVIKAVDTFGLDKAYDYVFKICKLELNETAADWLIELMQNLDATTYFGNNSLAHLASWFIKKAPTSSLEKHRRSIADLPENEQQFSLPDLDEELSTRARLEALNDDQIYQEICTHLENLDENTEFIDANIPQLERLIYQLDPTNENLKQTIFTNLQETLPNPNDDFSSSDWDFAIWVVASGHLKIEQATPYILEGFHIDWDWLNESIPTALATIGGESCLRISSDFYLQRQEELKDVEDNYDYVRSYLSGIYEDIESPLVADLIVTLLENENHDYIRVNLAKGIANQLDSESIAHVLNVYQEEPDDPERGILLAYLYTHAILTDSKPKELNSWKNMLERERKRIRQLSQQGYSNDSMLAQIMNRSANQASLSLPTNNILPFTRDVEKINRNSPCPCGSGKKYKKCCLN